MPQLNNILTPIDMIGALITERYEGETLREYRQRVLQVAGVLAKRDPSDESWLSYRETELEGRIGYPVQLEHGAHDEALRAEARERLFTYDRLATWQGPFRWPDAAASGEAPLYNHAAPAGSGVASVMDLAPLVAPQSGRAYATAGFCVYDGTLYYVPARLERLEFWLPTGTTQTVVLPWQIVSDHAHRIEVVDEDNLRLVAIDHEHVIKLGHQGWTFVSGPHTHEMIPVDVSGPCFLMSAPKVADTRTGASLGDTIAGANEGELFHAGGVPVLQLGPVEVSTTDGAHTALVDPYDYWSGNFTIGESEGGFAHTHQVVDFTVQEAAGHTHSLTTPTVPTLRTLVPVTTQIEDEVLEANPPGHPFAAHVRIEKGWTVVSSAHPFDETLVAGFDTGRFLPVPPEPIRSGYVWGLGPQLDAAALAFTSIRREGDALAVRVRTEDMYTGGVPHTTVRLYLSVGAYEGTITLVSDERAEAFATLPMPNDRTADSAMLEAELLDADGDVITSIQREVRLDIAAGELSGYGTNYGVSYGD